MDLISDPDSWQNGSFPFNETADNSSVVNVLAVSLQMDTTINILLVVTLCLVMVSLGCTMEVSKIKGHIVKPKGVAIAVLAQYGIMPLMAFCLAKAFQLTEIMAVSVLICGCCPGGTLSNVLALGLQGDMNLSIVMTSCSTLLALGMMPLLLFLYCKGFPNLQNAVPYANIMISLVMILVPCGIGILINHFRPQYAKIIKKVGLALIAISFLVIAIIMIIWARDDFLSIMSPSLLAIAALMPVIGFAFGYIISSVFRLSQRERRTVAVETGCQNTQLCATILKLAFPPELMGPMFMFPVGYAVLQLVEGLLLIVLFRCYKRFTKKENEIYHHPASTEDKLRDASTGNA
ncbi:sodium/bile acid cotransporter isoform X1 [Mugil cephalus]|uniref:sodium/bile acid cotransporter isoform X1 n=1 Tax=Mugil cephalus TaxID=48193 RepID=UPI001FB644D0|nr:sodium/bile acid cotransporter isoform X1 [Mugil cephalus]XP_047429534.1 sodium/bile acid cotransporter isoform X1 [Mugil cephalus]XP_047429535.1 sodium/bile acid cotransporter isoform X1 [Mugil cephalus]XP_047429536.1 sodium/bile acid cotransporter isoform X1 [Mugil cephalus]XP_047429537.1 sodium/bile acid cotransporter isoform X1 [Mugil cephalus]